MTTNIDYTLTQSPAVTYVVKTSQAITYAIGPQIDGVVYIIGDGGSPAPSIPVNTVLPAITGTYRGGETLTCSTGTWTGSPSSYAYQWQRDGVDITGETASTYVVTPTDIPALLTCIVVATNAGGDSLPATSAAVSSPLRAIYQIDPDARVWVHTQGTGVAVGNPVATWTTADGAWTLVQPTTSKQPTRAVDGLDGDGIDDWMSADDSAGLFSGPYTVIDGFHDVDDITTGNRQLWGSYTHYVSTGTRRCSHVQYSRPGSPSTTRQRYLLGANSSATVISLAGYSSLGAAGPYDLAFRSPDPGTGTADVTEITDPLGTPVTGAWGTVDMANDLHTILANRVNSVSSPSNYFEGTLRYHVVSGLELNDTQLGIYRDALAAEGVL